MIFLSYSHKDKAIVRPMAEAFRKTFGENNVFFDEWSIQPGDSLVDRMGEVSCSYGGSAGMYIKGFLKNVNLNNGETWNAFQISRSEATSPGFPFVVKLSASNDARISLKYTMRAVTIDSFKAVPLISNLQSTTKEPPSN